MNEHDKKMWQKGYRYKLRPKNAAFEPLYAKTMNLVTELMQDFKEVQFEILKMSHPNHYE